MVGDDKASDVLKRLVAKASEAGFELGALGILVERTAALTVARAVLTALVRVLGRLGS